MQQLRQNSVTLILGGVRSGKSRYAQQLATQMDPVSFIATAEPREDNEMRLKIARHRADRPQSWHTIEEPLELATAISTASSTSNCILIDCLTIFSANLLEAYSADESAIDKQVGQLCAVLNSAASHVILVSNEVGSGVVPAYPSGRRFRDLVGEINQRVASVADTVLLIVAGLPLALKGSIPREAGS